MSRPNDAQAHREAGADYVPPQADRRSWIGVFVALFTLWLLWSGHYTLDLGALFAGPHGEAAEHPVVNTMLLVFGLATCAGVVWLCHRMGIVDNETVPWRFAARSLRYLPWLAWQVVLANLEVIRRILRPAPGDRSETVVVEGSQRSDVGRATYANSITLTPGTVTIDVTGSTFTVHALTPASADGLTSGEMDREAARFEGLS